MKKKSIQDKFPDKAAQRSYFKHVSKIINQAFKMSVEQSKERQYPCIYCGDVRQGHLEDHRSDCPFSQPKTEDSIEEQEALVRWMKNCNKSMSNPATIQMQKEAEEKLERMKTEEQRFFCTKHQLNHGQKYQSCHPKTKDRECICTLRGDNAFTVVPEDDCPIHGKTEDIGECICRRVGKTEWAVGNPECKVHYPVPLNKDWLKRFREKFVLVNGKSEYIVEKKEEKHFGWHDINVDCSSYQGDLIPHLESFISQKIESARASERKRIIKIVKKGFKDFNHSTLEWEDFRDELLSKLKEDN